MQINILKGLNTVISPSSVAHQDGTFSRASNVHVDIDGVWKPTSGIITSPTRTVYADNGITTYTKDNIVSSGIAVPNKPTITAPASGGARMESGIYYYIATHINTTSCCEGEASDALEHYVERNFNGSDTRINDVPKINVSTPSGHTTAVYRTKVIYTYKGSEIQRVQQNDPTEFFFCGIASSGAYYDYLHDSELGRPYEGRGSVATASPAVIQAFDGRMFAFYSGYARYSSVGKPVEFAQKHEIVYYFTHTNGTWSTGTFGEALATGTGDTTTIDFVPVLENGVRSEARLWCPELIDKTVVDAYEFRGKLWVFTSTTIGYIIPTSGGYKYVHLSENFGGILGTLCLGDSFLYGCDSSGAWILDGNFPKRISDGIVNPSTITKAEWKNASKEYWFGNNTTGYIYNARLDSITSSVDYAYASYDMTIWLAGDNGNVKEDIRITLITTGTYTAKVYQGSYPNTSQEDSGTYTFDGSYNVNVIETVNSGRFTGIVLSSEDSDFSLSALHIEGKNVNEFARAYR